MHSIIKIRGNEIKLFFCFLAVLCHLTRLNGQSIKPDSIQNVFYCSLKNKLTIYLYGTSKFNEFDIKKSGQSTGISYKPNENFNLGLGFTYKWIGLSAAFSFKFLNNDDNKNGKTQSFGAGFDLYGKRIVWSGSIQTYKGYYWSNTENFNSTGTTINPVYARPDISSVNIGLSSLFSFNHDKFSFKAVFADNEWQKKSAGSLLFGGYVSLFGISADSSLVPFTLKNKYQEFDSIRALNSFNFGYTLGYTYTLVIKHHFYVNAALLIGLSLQTIELYNLDDVTFLSESNISGKINLRFGIGYNSENYYFGISMLNESYFINKDTNSQFTYNYGKIRLVYGRRF
jgi:hypothetical protein